MLCSILFYKFSYKFYSFLVFIFIEIFNDIQTVTGLKNIKKEVIVLNVEEKTLFPLMQSILMTNDDVYILNTLY